MSEPAPRFGDCYYEKVCDQAIATCDGNLRGTIKALIMANEYLEAELEQLHMLSAARRVPEQASQR